MSAKEGGAVGACGLDILGGGAERPGVVAMASMLGMPVLEEMPVEARD